jgi:sulfotransferase
MPAAYHFITGTPRSGSTLLSAILRQNPHFRASVTSPILSLMNSLYLAMGAHNEWSPFIDDMQRARMMRGVADQFYGPDFDGKVVFDTNRGWSAKMPWIAQLFPESRVIACVREFAWVIDSFERQFQKNSLLMSKLFSLDQATTQYARADSLSGYHGVAGFAWHALREAVFGEHRMRLILVDYEALTRDPQRTMAYLYDNMGMAPFAHDFNNVEFDGADEFDAILGTPGLHKVRRAVTYQERPSLLTPDIFERFRGHDYWKTPDFRNMGLPMCVWMR